MTLKKETEDIKRWTALPCLQTGKLNTVMMAILPTAMNRSTAVPTISNIQIQNNPYQQQSTDPMQSLPTTIHRFSAIPTNQQVDGKQ